jgi:hypothetical protein
MHEPEAKLDRRLDFPGGPSRWKLPGSLGLACLADALLFFEKSP